MSNLKKFVLNRQGVAQLMKGQDCQDMIKSCADTIVERLGEGYEDDIYVGVNRCNSTIRAVHYKTVKDNEENNTLLKNLFL